MKRRLRLVGVAATVDEFGRAHALDLAAQSQQRHREQVVREARVDAVAEEAGAARLAGLRDPLPQRSGNQRGVMEDPHARVDDILAGAQRRLDVRHVGVGLHHVGSEVGDRVGLPLSGPFSVDLFARNGRGRGGTGFVQGHHLRNLESGTLDDIPQVLGPHPS